MRPRSSASGRSVSVASSAMRERSTRSRREGLLVGAAEQEQCFGEVDRPGVDDAKTVDELVGVPVRIVAGDVEQRLRDRERGAQLVGGVGGESLLLGDLCFEPREHGVEGVGELAELVSAARKPDPVGERSGRCNTGGVGDPRQRGEHPAGEQPSSEQTEHEQNRQHDGRGRSVRAQEERVVPGHEAAERADHAVGHDAQQEVGRSSRLAGEPGRGQHQRACDHEEAGVAQGELQPNAQTGRSIHRLLPRPRCLARCRCGSRRRRRWRSARARRAACAVPRR